MYCTTDFMYSIKEPIIADIYECTKLTTEFIYSTKESIFDDISECTKAYN